MFLAANTFHCTSARATAPLSSFTEIPSTSRKPKDILDINRSFLQRVVIYSVSLTNSQPHLSRRNSVQDIEKKYYADGEDAYACRKIL